MLIDPADAPKRAQACPFRITNCLEAMYAAGSVHRRTPDRGPGPVMFTWIQPLSWQRIALALPLEPNDQARPNDRELRKTKITGNASKGVAQNVRCHVLEVRLRTNSVENPHNTDEVCVAPVCRKHEVSSAQLAKLLDNAATAKNLEEIASDGRRDWSGSVNGWMKRLIVDDMKELYVGHDRGIMRSGVQGRRSGHFSAKTLSWPAVAVMVGT